MVLISCWAKVMAKLAMVVDFPSLGPGLVTNRVRAGLSN